MATARKKTAHVSAFTYFWLGVLTGALVTLLIIFSQTLNREGAASLFRIQRAPTATPTTSTKQLGTPQTMVNTVNPAGTAALGTPQTIPNPSMNQLGTPQTMTK